MKGCHNIHALLNGSFIVRFYTKPKTTIHVDQLVSISWHINAEIWPVSSIGVLPYGCTMS